MADLYELVTPGGDPISVKSLVKPYLRVEHDDDDELIKLMVRESVQNAERYTGQSLRPQVWKLTIDEFADRICLRRSPVAAITTIQYLVSGSLVTIDDSVYYLKMGGPAFSEVLLSDGETWPTDIDEIEHGIEITFTTVAVQNLDQMKAALLKAIAYHYENRGDCDAEDAAKKSGATAQYDQIRIERV